MIEFFVKKPVTTVMFVLTFVVLGVYSFSNLLIEKTPKIDLPMVTAQVVYPGATPLEVETLVVDKVEDAVSEISGINKVESISQSSLGFIFVEFLLEEDVNVKLIEVKDKVEAIINALPKEIEKPVVKKLDILMEPVLDLTLSSGRHDLRDLYEYADKTLKNRLSALSGVASVDVYGGRRRQINVWLDPMLMKARYVTIDDVTRAIREKNANIPGGTLEKGYDAMSVRFVGEFQSVAEIGNLMLTASDGSKFRLKEIARVEDGFEKVESLGKFNGREVVGISLNKASDGNAVKISEEFRGRLKEFREILPEGMNLEISTDSTTFLKKETLNTEINILLGILLTVLILYVFTGKFRITLISAVIIPTSLISAFWPMTASDFSINFITLLAIATSMGTLIANAIVIIESVLVHLDRGKDPVRAAVEGTKEVSVAVLAATGTNLVVFMPIAMMGDIIGMFMRSFGLTVVYATLFSLLASFSLTPMMCALMLKGAKKNANGNFMLRILHSPNKWTLKAIAFMKSEYRTIFETMFKYPKLTVLFAVLCAFSLKFVMPYLDNEFMPDSDENRIQISVTMPQGSTIERTARVAEVLEERVEKIPEKISYVTRVGDGGVENANIVVDLVPAGERERTDTEIMNEVMVFASGIPDAEISISRAGMGPRRGGGQGDVSVEVSGGDYDELVELSEKMKRIMEKTGFFSAVISSHKNPKKEIRFIPDEEKLIEYGLNAADVGSVLRSSVYGDDGNYYREKGEEYDINVELDDRYAENLGDINGIMLGSKKGLVPVNQLGEIKYSRALPTIRHTGKKRIIMLEGFLAKGRLGSVKNLLDGKFGKIDFPPGASYRFMGSAEIQRRSGRELSKAFSLAVILTYILLAAILNSFRQPLSILFVVGLSFIGVFYALFFLGYSVSMIAMLTMIMLIGLAVNNAILLVDYAMQKMAEGVEIKEALWLAADAKFNAILMTTLSVIMGLLPQFASISELKKSMAAVILGGMTASWFFTFVFVPVAFWHLERFGFGKIFAKVKLPTLVGRASLF